jgi:hypothetical protein
MKYFFKWAYNQSVLLIKTIVSLLSIAFFSSFSAALNYKRHSEERKIDSNCFIIGNGYSLKQVLADNKDIFIEKDIIAVNLFYETPFFFNIKPRNYVIADEAFWRPASEERIIGIQNKFKENLLKVTWDMNLFVPNDGYGILLKIINENTKVNLIQYNRTPVSGYNWISHFLYKHNLGMPRPANVLNAAIFIALNLGYKKIHLYGADHSWISDLEVDENNNVCCSQNHFYDEKRELYKLPKGSLSDGLRGIVDAFDSYKLLETYSKYVNSHIVNSTKGSFIDIFDHELMTEK